MFHRVKVWTKLALARTRMDQILKYFIIFAEYKKKPFSSHFLLKIYIS